MLLDQISSRGIYIKELEFNIQKASSNRTSINDKDPINKTLWEARYYKFFPSRVNIRIKIASPEEYGRVPLK